MSRSGSPALGGTTPREHRQAWAGARCSPPLPGYLPLADAATWAGVSPRTLKRWIAAGLPKYQAGPRGKVLVRPGDIDQFLTRQQAPTPDLDAMVNEVLQGLTQGGA